MNALVCVRDYEKLAIKILPNNALVYYKTGAADEQSLQDNEKAFKKWRFRPLVLRDVSCVDISTTILGTKLCFPICIAPTGLNKMAYVDGEVASAKAAYALGTGFVLSTWATSSIEEIEAHVPHSTKWFQMIIFNDRDFTKSLVKRAEKGGFTAIVLTVDMPVVGHRYDLTRIEFYLPHHLSLKNLDEKFGSQTKPTRHSPTKNYFKSADITNSSHTWKDFKWIKSITTLPIILKGIMTAEMALEAVAHKVDGIIVSNHGGRQLDGVTSTINALPEVVEAVNGRCEVYMDGGIRNGGDVAKALALGAKCVFVGKPVIWGLACHGENGVKRILEILRDEFKQVMQLLGVRSIRELQTTKQLVVHDHVLQAKL